MKLISFNLQAMPVVPLPIKGSNIIPSLGVTNLNGPNFSIDNKDELQIQARRKAIEDAKRKSRILCEIFWFLNVAI